MTVPLKNIFLKKFDSEFDSLCKLLLSYVLVIAPPEWESEQIFNLKI